MDQLLSADCKFLIEGFRIKQKPVNRGIEFGNTVRDFKHQIVNLLIGNLAHRLAQNFDPVILDHGVRQQLVGGVFQRRLGLGLVRA